MSQEDILEKWIVLGTDSKAKSLKELSEEERLGKPYRIPMGEKGIGRLSVSFLGPTMLMATKKKNDSLQLLFLDWRILDNYNLFLEDLDIPLKTLSPGEDIGIAFDRLVQDFTNQIKKLNWDGYEGVSQQIKNTLIDLKYPRAIEKHVLQHITSKSGHGTCFIIFGPNQQLQELSDKDRLNFRDDESLTHLRSSIGGLFNSYLDIPPPFQTSFLIHDAKGKYNLIDDFFTREEMINKSDHWVSGEIDKYGFFSGEVRVFNQVFSHTFRPNRTPGETQYGPLKIEFGVSEGASKSSRLKPEEYANLSAKLKSFGGLYVYRDGFRVLPYGRPENDYLGFEERRSKSATYYFFSHRRMMGFIGIKRDRNPRLKDKAGREGFIDNKAFREFRSDLIEFFIDLAVRYFRTPGKEETLETSRSGQIETIRAKNERVLEAEKKKRKQTKSAFLKKLKESSKELFDFKEGVKSVLNQLKEEKDSSTLNYNVLEQVQNELVKFKAEWRELSVKMPPGTNVSDRKKQEYLDFKKEYELTGSLFEDCDQILGSLRNTFPLESLHIQYDKTYSRYVREIKGRLSKLKSRFGSSIKQIQEELDRESKEYQDLFKDQILPYSKSPDDSKIELAKKIRGVEQIADALVEKIDIELGPFIEHVENLTLDIDHDFLEGWYKEQKEKLEERLENLQELSQLGAAVEIIDHQFNVLYAQMADAIGELNAFLGQKDAAFDTLKRLQSSFQHLEQNHKLLKPLYRSSRRTRSVITGASIEQYIKEFFRTDLKRYRIQLEISDAFRQHEIFTFKSVLLPIFVNIINNAIYWLIPNEKRIIKIEMINNGIAVMNSGERIEDVYLEKIFNLFFTRKPDGRGIGLYLAKTNLEAIGYDIFASNDKEYNKLSGACFVIRKL